jgi:hypothetical protein
VKRLFSAIFEMGLNFGAKIMKNKTDFFFQTKILMVSSLFVNLQPELLYNK